MTINNKIFRVLKINIKIKIPPQNQTNDLPHFYEADSAVVSSKPFLSKVHKFFTGRFVVHLFFKIGDSTIYGIKS